jgi:hypothetical protein
MDLKTATPVEIDTELARIGTEMAKQYAVIDRAESTIAMERKYTSPAGTVNQRRIDQCQDLINAAGSELSRLMVERSPFEAEFVARDGWTRYYLVDNDNGHVHYDASNRRCSRTPSTSHIWLVDQSGREPEALVEDAGERACTVCFPWAPLETLKRPTMFHTPTELEKLEARKVREQRAAVRAAKAITNPDGTPLRNGGRYGERINSVVSAERAVIDIRVWAKIYHRALDAEELADIERILVALAHKRGTDVETERAALESRYVAKCKREGVTP